MAYTKYSLTPANNNAAPPDGAPEGMLPSAVNDTMRDMMAQIRDCGDGIRGGTYTMTAPIITGGSINNTPIGASTRAAGSFTTVTTTNDSSISGLTIGKGGGAITTNTAIGVSALTSNSTGVSNVAIGHSALYSSTSSNNTSLGYFAGYSNTGTQNTFVGYQSGYANTTGNGITAIGARALYSNTTGTANVALGGEWFGNINGALQANTTGNYNVASGVGALGSNTTGSNNSAFGHLALFSNTTANANTAVGINSLTANTTGIDNSAVGTYALTSNTTGIANAAVGYSALYSNTTGSYNAAFGKEALAFNTTASSNTAVGFRAGYSCNNTAPLGENTIIGYNAGYGMTTGYRNTILGSQAGYNATTAHSCTFIGRKAGLNTTGKSNTFIGSRSDSTDLSAGADVTTGYNNTIVGNYSGNQGSLDIRTANNYIVLSDGDGNPRGVFDSSGIFYVGPVTANLISTATVGWYSKRSDGGFQRMQSANTSDWGITATSGNVCNFYSYNAGLVWAGFISVNGNTTSYASISDYRLKENIKPIASALDTVAKLKPVTFDFKNGGQKSQGFIAHELQSIVPDAVTGKKDEVDAEGKPVYQGVDASFLVATLTAAIQELKAEVDSLKQQLGK